MQEIQQQNVPSEVKSTGHFIKYKFIYIICAIFIVIVLLILTRGENNGNNEPVIPKTTQSIPVPAPTLSHRIEGQISVKFKRGVSNLQIRQDLQHYNAEIIKTIPQINWTVIKVPEEQTDEVLARLSKDGFVEKVEPNYKIYSTAVPNDPLYQRLYYLKNTGQTVKERQGIPGADINIEPAWDVTMGNGIKVAVIDSGINLTHEDLQNKVVAQRSFIEGDTSVEDGAGHGTVDAGILAANANNGIGVAGVCPGCQLIIARTTDDNASGSTASTAEGIMWSADQGAQVINMSLGGEQPSDLLQEAVGYANQKGAILVAAAGNCGDDDFRNNFCSTRNPMFYPAANEGVIAVTATDNTDKRYEKANFGTWIKIAAPGFGIFSTVPNHPYTQGTELNYSMYDGTSQAAPMVSGVLALLLSTGISREEAIQRMYTAADKIPGTGADWEHGRLNAGKALSQALVTPTLPPGTLPSQAVQPTTTAPIGGNPQPGPSSTQTPTQGFIPNQPNPTCIYNSLGGIPCLPSSEPSETPEQPEKSRPNTPVDENNDTKQSIIELILLLLISLIKFITLGTGD